jgi:hypothetical protein
MTPAPDRQPSLAEFHQLLAYGSRLSLRFFLDNVVINSTPEPRAWKTIREPWQDEVLAPKLPAFEYLSGRRETHTGPMSFFDVLARGHDKSSLEGRLASGLLLSSRRPISGYIVAADKDQGKLLVEAVKEETALNPWLEDLIRFPGGNQIVGPAGKVTVVPADAGGAFGYRGNLFIFDELCNWDKPVSKKVYEAVMSGTEKRQPRIVVVISNAGYHGSWQEKVYETVKRDPEEWSVFDRQGHLASWMTEDRIAKLARILTPMEARRLFYNHWINPGDEGFLSLEDAERCIDETLVYRLRRQPGVLNYVASIDYGPKRDRTVCMVAHMDSDGRVLVDRMDVWEGKSQPNGRVEPSVIRRWIEDVEKGFDPVEYVVDPAGLASESEWMRNKRLPLYEYQPRGGAGNFAIAQALKSMVTGGAVRWYEGCGFMPGSTFEDELARLVTVQKSYGHRIDHTSTQHDDRAVALGMLLVRAVEFPAR